MKFGIGDVGRASTAPLLESLQVPENLTAALLFVALTLILKAAWKYVYEGDPIIRKLPGPWSMPVFGNFLQLTNNPHIRLTNLREKYGDVYRIYIGNQPVVIVNGLKLIKQALGKQSVDFADRPDFDSFRQVTGGESLAFGRYDETWKLHRRIGDSAVKIYTSGGQLQVFQEKVISEMLELINILTDNNNQGGHTSNPQDAVKISAANIICEIAFGKRYVHSDAKIREVVTLSERFNNNAGGFANPIDFMPWLRFLPNPKTRELGEILEELTDWVQQRIADHRATYRPNVQRDIMDNLLHVSQEVDRDEVKRRGITETRILGTVQDIFAAGFDTTSLIIHWALLYLAKYPGIQRRLQQDLDAVVGRDALPTLANRDQLPRLDAFLYELLRHTTVVPFGLPHAATRDTAVGDYAIPKGTVVYFNLWSSNRDPDLWPEPDQFRPERFLAHDGRSLDKSAMNNIVPFSLGRRKCLGENLAKIELFLALAVLLHQCEFKESQDGLPNLEGRYGLALKPQSFKLHVKQR